MEKAQSIMMQITALVEFAPMDISPSGKVTLSSLKQSIKNSFGVKATYSVTLDTRGGRLLSNLTSYTFGEGAALPRASVKPSNSETLRTHFA